MRTQPQTSALPRDEVYNAPLLCASALALKYIAVNPRLDVVLDVREGREAEVEESFAIAVSDGAREEETDEALLVARVGTSRTEHGPGYRGLSPTEVNYIHGRDRADRASVEAVMRRNTGDIGR